MQTVSIQSGRPYWLSDKSTCLHEKVEPDLLKSAIWISTSVCFPGPTLTLDFRGRLLAFYLQLIFAAFTKALHHESSFRR